MSKKKQKGRSPLLNKARKYALVINIAVSVIFLALGVFMAVNPELFTDIIFIALGVVMLLLGGLCVAQFFIKKQTTVLEYFLLFFGVLLAAAGIMFLCRPDFIKDIVSIMIGVYVLFTSFATLIQVINVRKGGGSKILIPLILSILGIIIGALCVLGFLIAKDFVTRFTGIMLLVYEVISITDLIMIEIKLRKIGKSINRRNTSDNDTIEIEATEE